MGNRFDELRDILRDLDIGDVGSVKAILFGVIDELEKVHDEIRQGFTRPE